MFELIKHLVKNDIQHTVSDNGNITVTNNLDLEDVSGADALPDNLTVGGWLDLSGTSITALPDNLTVGGGLDLRGTSITALPDNLTVGGGLDLRGTSITTLPDNLTVGGGLYLSGNSITTLPDNLTVGGWLDLSGNSITTLPDNLTVGGWLDLRGTSITTLPDHFSCNSLYLEAERISNIAYRKNCGYSSRTIFAAWTGKEFRIAAGCFFGSIEQFEQAVDDKYNGSAAEAYKKAARDCVAELTVKLNPKD
ncbi:hypothetical protein INJ43_003549 [Salmonella enterica]|nr:hypothetical protein [Salmonella enterica]EGL0461531.1 hypothetical protein [Salmonella enterica]EIS1067524.1 hypothetical protein [Salmonella enterica]EKH5662915.1 hypothetical protein [Salmonella enterica]ELC8533915.1 hypothetical protein [Salmonella enterica]